MLNLAGEAEEGGLKLDFYGQLGLEFRGAKAAESPAHGCQEGLAHNRHFCSRCYHPLFIFNQLGDCGGTQLRPGDVHSAGGWRGLLEPMVKRYSDSGKSSTSTPVPPLAPPISTITLRGKKSSTPPG